ncbi:UDP-N-acetylmuramate dehydrogenase [Luteimonas sp. e5]
MSQHTAPAGTIREHSHAALPNTFALPAHARRLLQVSDVDQLPQALARAGDDALLIGAGSNLLLVAEEIDCAVQVSDRRIDCTREADGSLRLRVAAGMVWHELVMHSLAIGGCGLENLALIPGSVGAAPIQNIGAYGVEVMDLIERVEVHDRQRGQTRWWSHRECGFSYRDSAFKHDPQRHAVLRVEFRLGSTPRLKLDYAGIGSELEQMGVTTPGPRDVAAAVIRLRQRKLPDPAQLPNAGSFFKNPLVPLAKAEALRAEHPALPLYPAADPQLRKLSAAWLIEQCGWKGRRQGDAGIAPGHALVLVNHGRASGAQLLALAREVAASVQQRFGVCIEPEPRLIGADW